MCSGRIAFPQYTIDIPIPCMITEVSGHIARLLIIPISISALKHMYYQNQPTSPPLYFCNLSFASGELGEKLQLEIIIPTVASPMTMSEDPGAVVESPDISQGKRTRKKGRTVVNEPPSCPNTLPLHCKLYRPRRPKGTECSRRVPRRGRCHHYQ